MCSAFRLFFRGSLTPCCSYYHCAFRQHDVSTPASSQQTWIAPDIPPIGLRHYDSPSRFQAATEFGRQPSGDSRLGFLCVFYPGSNNQRDNKTCGTYFHYLAPILFEGKKKAEQAIMIMQAASLSRRAWSVVALPTGSVQVVLQWQGCVYLGAGDPCYPPDTVQLLRTII